MGERARRSRAEVSFHAGLFAILLPVITVPVLWGLALHNLAHDRENATQRRWTRRLFGLAVLDTLVAVSLVVASALGMSEDLAAAQGGPRIGVILEEEAQVLEVREVLPGSPADEAGLEPGDRVVAVEGQPVTTRDALASGLSVDRAVPITVQRDGTTRELEVRARETLEPPPVLPSETCPPISAPRESPWALAPYGLVLVLVLALWLRGRARGVPQWRFWLPFGAVLFAASVVGTFAQYAGCAAFGGPGLRAMAASLFLSEVFLVSVAMVWLFLARRRGAPPLELDDGEPWSIPRTYGTGLFYAMAWLPRIAMLSVPLLWAAQRLEVLEVSPMLEDVLGAAGTDPVSAVLVALAAAVLAPLAEEALFRGLLLPHLGRALAAWPAMITSAVVFGLLHVSHGVMLLGPLVLGVVMGWARVRSRGLAAPILLHVSFNAVAVLSSWLR